MIRLRKLWDGSWDYCADGELVGTITRVARDEWWWSPQVTMVREPLDVASDTVTEAKLLVTAMLGPDFWRGYSL